MLQPDARTCRHGTIGRRVVTNDGSTARIHVVDHTDIGRLHVGADPATAAQLPLCDIGDGLDMQRQTPTRRTRSRLASLCHELLPKGRRQDPSVPLPQTISRSGQCHASVYERHRASRPLRASEAREPASGFCGRACALPEPVSPRHGRGPGVQGRSADRNQRVRDGRISRVPCGRRGRGACGGPNRRRGQAPVPRLRARH
jgi:hypothetical protein